MGLSSPTAQLPGRNSRVTLHVLLGCRRRSLQSAVVCCEKVPIRGGSYSECLSAKPSPKGGVGM